MDLALFQFIRSFNGTTIGDWLGVFFAQYLPYVIGIAFIIFIVRERTWKKKMWLVLTAALTALLSRGFFTTLIRFWYERPRPFEALGIEPLLIKNSPAFPSGHAAFFFALAWMVWRLNKKWGYWFMGAAALNGLARVFVGIHWVSDILGGFLVATLSFFIVERFLKLTAPPSATEKTGETFTQEKTPSS